MNKQYFEERSSPSDIVEKTQVSPDSSIVKSDNFKDKVPVDAALIHETPMGGTLASMGPLNGPLPDQVPLFETPLQEIPMGGTVAPVGPMNETIVREEEIGITVPSDVMVREPIVEESRVSDPIPYMAPVGAAYTSEPSIDMNAGSSAALLTREETEHFRTRWSEIQGKFVDEPRLAVQQADALVSEVSAQITQIFAREHSSLEDQWNRGNDVSIEDLRMALQHYRSFFNRLVI